MNVGRALGPGRLWRRPLPRGGASWTLDYTDGRGKRRRVVLGSDRRVAERRRAELIRARDLELAGLGGEAGMTMLLAELAELHLADLATRSTPHHLRNVRSILERALAAIPAKRVRDLRPYDLVTYRQGLIAAGRSHRSTNLAVDRVRAMLAWGARLGLIAESPIRALDRLPEGPKYECCRRRALSEDEVARYLHAAEDDDRRQIALTHRRAIPQAPVWRFLVEGGSRYGETVRLTWGDVDLATRLVQLRGETTKAGRPRIIPLTQAMTLALLALRKAHEAFLGRAPTPGDLVFLTPLGKAWPWHTVNAMRVHDRLLAKAGIPRIDEHGRKVDLHGLRHSAATRFARAGVPLVTVQHLLGHADPKLTARVYQHVEVDDLRAAVERLGSASDRAPRQASA